tara:strand:- start:249 stop:455 length:207 start_codon:yes stop_codon:yes gene_type:complete
MTYLFVVFIFINGVWVQGDDIEGWGSMPYESLESCLNAVSRAEKIQNNLLTFNPKAHQKRFECQEMEE